MIQSPTRPPPGTPSQPLVSGFFETVFWYQNLASVCIQGPLTFKKLTTARLPLQAGEQQQRLVRKKSSVPRESGAVIGSYHGHAAQGSRQGMHTFHL
jgi:hypothetical protein